MDVSSGSPVLVQEGVIDPGPGVATFFPSAAQDAAGNIGISYMQSSSTEFVSAYVAGHVAGTPLGSTSPGAAFGVGAAVEAASFRNGDYGTAVYDPGTGLFWGANEYSGADAATNIWRTKIASFSLFSRRRHRLLLGQRQRRRQSPLRHLHAGRRTASSSSTTSIPSCLLYDPNGNLVAVAAGNASDGRNSVIDFTVPDGDAGKWTIEVTPSPNTEKPTQGEYGLLVTGATGALSPFVVTSTIPPTVP